MMHRIFPEALELPRSLENCVRAVAVFEDLYGKRWDLIGPS